MNHSEIPVISFLTPEMRAFFGCTPPKMSDHDIRAYWSEKKKGLKDASAPNPMILESNSIVTVQCGNDTKTFAPKNGKAEIVNLIPNKTYTCIAGENSFCFTVPDEPRVLFIEGVPNSRDIGGMIVPSGKRVKHGMIFRTQELDGITENGLKFLRECGIRTDLDLRSNTECRTSPLLFAAHVNIPVAPYGGIFAEEQKALWRDVFSLLSDEKAYPLVVHCVGGIDRTGTLCVLLGLLLGANEDVLASDYEFSGFAFTNFTERSRYSQSYTELIAGLRQYNSDLRCAVELWLLHIGVTAQQIENIGKILLTESSTDTEREMP